MGAVSAFSPAGARKWTINLYGEITSTPALGANDYIYVGVSYGVNDQVLAGAVYYSHTNTFSPLNLIRLDREGKYVFLYWS